jgi:putative nucleotidyltransferase with HDIG domain
MVFSKGGKKYCRTLERMDFYIANLMNLMHLMKLLGRIFFILIKYILQYVFKKATYFRDPPIFSQERDCPGPVSVEKHSRSGIVNRFIAQGSVTKQAEPSLNVEDAVRLRVFHNLKPICFGLAILFEIYAISYLLLLPKPESTILALVASGSCALAVFFRVALEFIDIPRSYAHEYSFFIAVLVLSNSFLVLFLVPEPRQTMHLLLLMMGVGFLLLSTKWFFVCVFLAWLGWGAAVWYAGVSTLWLEYGFTLFSATFLTTIIHVARVRSVRKLEKLKLNLEEKVRERTRTLEIQLDELRALHDISVLATQTLDEGQVISQTVELLNKALFPERLSIMLLNKEKDELILSDPCQDFVTTEEVHSIPVGEGVTGRVASTGRLLRIPDVREVDYYIEDDPSMRSELCVPIKAGEEILGVINVNSREVDDFSESDERFLTTLAGQLASAIDRIRWFDETRRMLNRLNSLHRIDQAINNSTELIPILNVFLKEITMHLKMDAVSVLLYNQQNQSLDYFAGRGFNNVDHHPLRSGTEAGYLGKVFRDREIVIAPEVDLDHSSNGHRNLFELEGFQSYISVPLIAKDELKGVLELFFREPAHPQQDWMESLRSFANQAAIAIDNIMVFSDLQQANIDLHMTYNKTLEGWAKALELRDAETEGHSRRVSELAGVLGQNLGLGDRELVHLYWGALLHDIGKLGIPDQVLHKKEPLTKKERELIEQHPYFGRELLREIEYLQPAIDILYYHHEKWDGTGYPQGLMGDQIPLKARIFAVIDVYDALCSDRPYRKAWPEDKAIEYIRDQAGKHFDPEVVDIFLKVVN